MSAAHKYDIDIRPCRNKTEAATIIKKIPYPIDGWDLSKHDKTLRTWGESSFCLSRDMADRHAELVKLFPRKKVASRWRCTEYDEWDEMYPWEET